jgi:hypothetical protein
MQDSQSPNSRKPKPDKISWIIEEFIPPNKVVIYIPQSREAKVYSFMDRDVNKGGVV